MRKPDLESASTKAWKIPLSDEKKNGDKHGCVANWLVKGPFHPFWNHWAIMVVHLRETPGLKAPYKKLPEMTHEFIIVALDPGSKDNPTTFDPDNLPFPLPYLTPIDVVVQFKCDSDAQAASVCDAAVQTIIVGAASPDQDWRSFWERAIPATASCDKHGETKLH